MNCLWLLLLAFGIAQAETRTGLAVGISDGDTIIVLDAQHRQIKVCLAGIDAKHAGAKDATALASSS